MIALLISIVKRLFTLVPEARHWWRMASFYVTGFATVIVALDATCPDWVIQLMPLWLSHGLSILSVAAIFWARLIQQFNLPKPSDPPEPGERN